jgi:hypothetical protein
MPASTSVAPTPKAVRSRTLIHDRRTGDGPDRLVAVHDVGDPLLDFRIHDRLAPRHTAYSGSDPLSGHARAS